MVFWSMYLFGISKFFKQQKRHQYLFKKLNLYFLFVLVKWEKKQLQITKKYLYIV